MKNPMNDDDYTGNDEQIADLKDLARTLYNALKQANQALEEASDILHYEDGKPVTYLESDEIERAYTSLVSPLVEIDKALGDFNEEFVENSTQ